MVKFSVIIPVYNRADLIQPTLESVVNQSTQPYEIIICDDGSTDGTPGVIRSLLDPSGIRYKILEIRNSGPSRARKTAVESARGDWYLFLDSDDIWDKDYIESVQNIITRYHPDCVATDFRIWERNSKRFLCESKFATAPEQFWTSEAQRIEDGVIITKPVLFKKALSFQPVFQSALACCKETYLKSGGITLDNRTLKSEDAHFTRKLFFYGTFVFQMSAKVTIVIHGANRSCADKDSIDFPGKLYGRVKILEMMRDIGEIERAFGVELKQEIANSKLVLFDQYYWYARFKEACLIFPDLDYRKIRPKIMMKYVLSRLKSCRQAKKAPPDSGG